MADFNAMGGVPDFYGSILADARRNLVRKPDGTLAPAPVFGQPTSVNDIYRGMLPTAPPAPRSPVGAGPGTYGNLVGLVNDPIYSGGSSSGAIRTVGQAGTVAMPPGARPASVDRGFAQMGQQPSATQRSAMAAAPLPPITLPSGPGPVGFVNTAKATDRLTPSTGLAFAGDTQPSAVAAIDSVAGAMPPLPRIRPNMPMPTAPRTGGNSSVAALQQQLASRGFSPGAIDGIKGRKTDAAIRAFQQANGLKVDGIVGPKTMAALQGTSASTAPTPASRPALPMPRAPQSGAEPFGLMSMVKGLPDLSTKSARTAAIDAPLKKIMNGAPKPKPPAVGSKGYSAAGLALKNQFRRKK